MSYKVMCRTTPDTTFATNALRFATEAEARLYGEDLFMRWTAMESDWYVDQSSDPVNYKIENNALIRLEEGV
jgi:hypothetical protein